MRLLAILITLSTLYFPADFQERVDIIDTFKSSTKCKPPINNTLNVNAQTVEIKFGTRNDDSLEFTFASLSGLSSNVESVHLKTTKKGDASEYAFSAKFVNLRFDSNCTADFENFDCSAIIENFDYKITIEAPDKKGPYTESTQPHVDNLDMLVVTVDAKTPNDLEEDKTDIDDKLAKEIKGDIQATKDKSAYTLLTDSINFAFQSFLKNCTM